MGGAGGFRDKASRDAAAGGRAPRAPDDPAALRPPGPAGLLVEDLRLTAIFDTPNGRAARFFTPDGRDVLLRKGDRVRDGRVVRIEPEAVVFARRGDDPTSPAPAREVRAPLPLYRPIRSLGRAAYAFNVPTGLRYRETQDVLFRVDPTTTALQARAALEEMQARDSRLPGAVEATTGPWSRCMEAELVETPAGASDKPKVKIRPLVQREDDPEEWVEEETGARSLVHHMGLHPTDWRWRIEGIRAGRTQLSLNLYSVAVPARSPPGSRECGAYDSADAASARQERTLHKRLFIEVSTVDWVEATLPSPWLWSLLLPPAGLALAWWRRRRGVPVLGPDG